MNVLAVTVWRHLIPDIHNSRITRVLLVVLATLLLTSCSGQKADPDFDASIPHPAFPSGHPMVLLDEANNNIHTTEGTYKPFVDLISSDGYSVVSNKNNFSAKRLEGFDILVISNAKGK